MVALLGVGLGGLAYALVGGRGTLRGFARGSNHEEKRDDGQSSPVEIDRHGADLTKDVRIIKRAGQL